MVKPTLSIDPKLQHVVKVYISSRIVSLVASPLMKYKGETL